MNYKQVEFHIGYPVSTWELAENERNNINGNLNIRGEIIIKRNYFFTDEIDETKITKDCETLEREFSIGGFEADCGWWYTDSKPISI